LTFRTPASASVFIWDDDRRDRDECGHGMDDSERRGRAAQVRRSTIDGDPSGGWRILGRSTEGAAAPGSWRQSWPSSHSIRYLQTHFYAVARVIPSCSAT
jgi:hypothetical protein